MVLARRLGAYGLGCVLASLGALAPDRTLASEAVSWKVVAPLRVYGQNEAITAAVMEAVNQTADPDVVARLARIGPSVVPVAHEATAANETAAIAQRRARFWGQAYRIQLRLNGGRPGSTCLWRGHSGDSPPTPCSQPVELDVPTGLDGQARTQVTVDHDGVTTSVLVAVGYRLVVGWGDSYASGEGNPDQPADLGAVLARPPTTYGWLKAVQPDTRRYRPAAWSHRNCHRSIFSYQLLAAAMVADDDPHLVTGYVPLSCSGSSVYDGVLLPQAHPPGGKTPNPSLRPRSWR